MGLVWGLAVKPARRLLVVALLWLAGSSLALAQDIAQLHTSLEDGFGRMVLKFEGRVDLPVYRIAFENNVLAITFDEPVQVALPEVSAMLPGYLTIARVDPDQRGLRFGLRTAVNVHSMEAGERLFVDILPNSWQGLPPSLPQGVIAELTIRAKQAAIDAERERRAALARSLNPTATLRVGKNPTFVRLQFDWTADTEASFTQDGANATLRFNWPVEVDLYALEADLPADVLEVRNTVTADGTDVALVLAEGVVPRFYAEDRRHFMIDIDLSSEQAAGLRASAEASSRQLEEDAAAAATEQRRERQELPASAEVIPVAAGEGAGRQIVPVVEDVAGTIRVKFPFDRDTPSAAFRRGDTLWMVFDTRTVIGAPAASPLLDAIASGFSVTPAGETQIVRLDLASSRLSTLASEGRSWVLSFGDMLLDATAPVSFKRSRDEAGHFRMSASLGRPYRVHSFRDPLVGDLLDIVTAYPPARGAVRDLAYVDFDALRSVHGLVLRRDNERLEVGIDKDAVVIAAPGGLTLSDREPPRVLDAASAQQQRASFVDFGKLRAANPGEFSSRLDELSAAAADKEGQARDVARLTLAQYYVGNQFAIEGLGVLRVLEGNLTNEELRRRARLTGAIANVLAGRTTDGLRTLNGPAYDDQVDALLWRTIARTDAGDFVGARTDALAAEPVLPAYPLWVQQKFLFAGIRSGIESADLKMAQRFLDAVTFAQLNPDEVSFYQLFRGRIAEAQGRTSEALDSYGQVIGADARPSRAEAVYRTMLMLRGSGQIDIDKATATLAAESMLWRGNQLEAQMETLLADLYFTGGNYRRGFETVKAASLHGAEGPIIDDLTRAAEAKFADLYLNGAADQLSDLDALSLYYDFRNLTPTGARGDEMIRNLARRLVKVDLLPQAADLLQYQVDHRLQGAAQAQVATELALIRIADHDPEAALGALNQTRLASIAPSLDRQRRLIEARALIDSGRADLAVDLLTRLDGLDVDLLRVDAFWNAKNYLAAADLIETMYSGRSEPTALDDAARLSLVKAAVGFVLARDDLGLSRLRNKFSEQMAQSPQWALFDYITSPEVSPTGMEFKQAAKLVAGLDTITAFLDAYRQLYPVDAGIVPAQASTPSA